jgi:protein-L-isoaspartate(D-aspartate) O-methyltransferase
VVKSGDDERCLERDALFEAIEEDVRLTADWTGRKFLASSVFDAMSAVAREDFVSVIESPYAYRNMPLPIGNGQTISQPFIVALMTDLLEVGSDDVILEVGTGSGYQAAVLSRLVRKLYSVEVISELAESAAARLATLGFDNVEVRNGDGSRGWEEHAPFDGIIVTAAALTIPPALVEQLKPGRRLLIPVGPLGNTMLQRITKDEHGEVDTEDILPVAFVPLKQIEPEAEEYPGKEFAPPGALEWNVVATARDGRYMAACRLLDRLGWLEETDYHNVLVLRVRDVEQFLEEFRQRWSADTFSRGCFSRVVPVTATFSYESLDELEAQATEALRPWIPTLAGRSYHVRMHRRGFKDRVDSHTEEQALGAFVERELVGTSERARVDFDDPDFIVVLETVDQRGGMSLWSREQRQRYPFLNLD